MSESKSNPSNAHTTREAAREAARHQREAADAAQRVAEEGERAAETAIDEAARAADAGTKAAHEGREVMLLGMHAVADANGRLADTAYDRGHRMLSQTTQALDTYRDAAERTAGHVQALFSSCVTYGRGLQRMQHAWLEMVNHAAEQAAHKPQDLLRCRSLSELAEVQRDLYVGAVTYAFDASATLLDLATKAAQEAARPLSQHREGAQG